MIKRPPRRLEYATVIGVPAAIGIVLAAQCLEGSPARNLWQPTAALVVFGGTFVCPASVRATSRSRCARQSFRCSAVRHGR